MPKRITLPYLLTATIILIALGTTAILSNTSAQSTTFRPRPPASCTSCNTHLLDRSLAQLGDYVVDALKSSGSFVGESPEVLLTRMIDREDYSVVGLGCPPDSASIEQPPLALVILKGNLHYNGPGMRSTISESQYAAIVLDLWAGAMTSQYFSTDGRGLGQILNDPFLPVSEPYICPPPLLHVPYHYGETAPPIKHYPPPSNTYTPAESATLTAGPTNPVPPTPVGSLPPPPPPQPTKGKPAP